MRRVPRAAGPWRRIVEHEANHLNDFCLFEDRQGRWHAIGILGTGTWASEVSLFHSSGDSLDLPMRNHARILTETPTGRLAPQKHAPFVAVENDSYHMFYRQPPGTIIHLQTQDPDRWSGLGTVVFEERDARDVCILQHHGCYLMYYCQSREVGGVLRSCILARQSSDLLHWGDPSVVQVDTIMPTDHSYLESPFVTARPEGLYLFVRHRLKDERSTTVVFFSEDPLDFGQGPHEWFCELDHVHAAELVRDGQREYIARVSGPEIIPGVVEVAPLDWR